MCHIVSRIRAGLALTIFIIGLGFSIAAHVCLHMSARLDGTYDI